MRLDLIRACLALLQCLAAGSRALGSGIDVALVPSASSVEPGNVFEVAIWITSVESPFNGYDAVVSYDPALLGFVAVPPESIAQQEGELMTGACPQRFHRFEADPSSLRVSHALLCAGARITSTGELYVLRFRAGGRTGRARLGLEDSTLFYVAGFSLLPSSLTPAEVEIRAPTALALSDLSAMPEQNGILLRWRARHGDFMRFEVLREPGPSAPDAGYEPLRPDRPVRGAGPWEYLDTDVSPGRSYAYKILGRPADGKLVVFGPVSARLDARGFDLLSVQPNPTRGVAYLHLELSRLSDVRLEVFDPAGRRVRRLLAGGMPPGTHAVAWDGRDDRGHDLGRGVYYVRLLWPGGATSRQVTLLR